jgi:hypothetical protein
METFGGEIVSWVELESNEEFDVRLKCLELTTRVTHPENYKKFYL